jgi:hypothetical protein
MLLLSKTLLCFVVFAFLGACQSDTTEEKVERLVGKGSASKVSGVQYHRAAGGMQSPYVFAFQADEAAIGFLLKSNQVVRQADTTSEDIVLVFQMVDTAFAKNLVWWPDSNRLRMFEVFGETVRFSGQVQSRFFFVNRKEKMIYMYGEQAFEIWVDLLERRATAKVSTTGPTAGADHRLSATLASTAIPSHFCSQLKGQLS